MALTLAAAHSSARSDGSSSSDEGSVPPQTPSSPTNHAEALTSGCQKSSNNTSNNNTNNNNNSSTNMTGGTSPAPKKKASRRANTAERRATHNAVERARRETLNGRFLVCFSLLTNFCSVFLFLTTRPCFVHFYNRIWPHYSQTFPRFVALPSQPSSILQSPTSTPLAATATSLPVSSGS